MVATHLAAEDTDEASHVAVFPVVLRVFEVVVNALLAAAVKQDIPVLALQFAERGLE